LKKFAKLALTLTIMVLIISLPVTALAGAGGGGGAIPPPAPPRAEGIPNVVVPEGYVAFYDFRGDVVITVENPTRVAVFDDGILALMMGVGLDTLGIEKIGFAQRNLDNLGWRDFGSATPVPSGTLFMHDVAPLVSVAPQLFMTGARSFGMCRYYTGVAQPRFSAATPDFGFGTRAQQEQALWDALLAVEPDMAVAHMTVNMAAANLRTDMRVNVDILARIFPNAADALRSQFAGIEEQLDEIKDFVQGEGLNAVIFRVTGTAGMGSAFGYNTRWSFIYDEFGFSAALPTGWPYTPAQMSAMAAEAGVSLFEIQAQILLDVNPDVIFFVDSTDGATGYGPAFAQLTANPHIQQTSAYRNGFIIGGLPNTEWYTTVGGFPSIQRMIDDVNRFVEIFRAIGGGVNIDELSAAIADASARVRVRYTPATWAALQNALTAANIVLADLDATQAQIDAANTALREAIAALVVAQQTGGGSGGGGGAVAQPAPTPAPQAPPATQITDDEVPLAGLSSFAAFIEGFPDHTFRGENQISREEFIKILFRLNNPGRLPEASSTRQSFTDVAPGRWSFDAIEWAVTAGIIDGGAATFLPGNELTRAEMAAMLSRAEGWTEGADNIFSDIEGHSQSEYVLKAVYAGVFEGFPNGTFRPNATATRFEMVTALVRYALGGSVTDDMIEGVAIFRDVPNTHWAFRYVVLATVGYEAQL